MKILIKRLSVVIMLSFMPFTNADNKKTPVMVGGNDGLDACMSNGMVTGLKADGDGFLAVRSGAGAHYQLVDKLKEGQSVSICDSSADEQWLGVVYDLTGKQDCGVGTPIDPKRPYQGPCKSGWVYKKWIMMTAG